MQIRMSHIFVTVFTLAAIIMLYASVGFYVDRTEAEACTQSQEQLEEISPIVLLDQANYLLPQYGEPELDTISSAIISQTASNLRDLKSSNDEKRIDLTTFELSHFLLKDYLSKSNCNLNKNVVIVNLERSVLFFGENLKQASLAGLESEIEKTEDSYQTIIHSSIQSKCGFEPDNPFLQILEEGYCEALHEQSFLFAKELKDGIDTVEDTPSKVYRAILLNCLGDCVNKDQCLDNCLNEKLA
ncbi:hypothetical protein ACFLQI_01250 [Candidatus Undinarchaeota archaeon]